MTEIEEVEAQFESFKRMCFIYINEGCRLAVDIGIMNHLKNLEYEDLVKYFVD